MGAGVTSSPAVMTACGYKQRGLQHTPSGVAAFGQQVVLTCPKHISVRDTIISLFVLIATCKHPRTAPTMRVPKQVALGWHFRQLRQTCQLHSDSHCFHLHRAIPNSTYISLHLIIERFFPFRRLSASSSEKSLLFMFQSSVLILDRTPETELAVVKMGWQK